MSSTRTVHVFYNAHMALAHNGLNELLEKAGVELRQKDWALFVNRSLNRFKILTGNGVLAYWKKTTSGKTPFRLSDLDKPSEAFGGKMRMTHADKRMVARILSGEFAKKNSAGIIGG